MTQMPPKNSFSGGGHITKISLKVGNFPTNPIGIFYQFSDDFVLLSTEILVNNKFYVFVYNSDPIRISLFW